MTGGQASLDAHRKRGKASSDLYPRAASLLWLSIRAPSGWTRNVTPPGGADSSRWGPAASPGQGRLPVSWELASRQIRVAERPVRFFRVRPHLRGSADVDAGSHDPDALRAR